MKGKKTPSFADYLMIIIKRRYFIIKTFLIVVIASIIISLIIPNKYIATATILPPNPQQDAMMGLIQSSISSGLSGLSGFSSFMPGATTPSDLFAALLTSGRIMGKVIKKHELKKVFRTKTGSDTYEMLRSITKVGVTPEGIISIKITWYDRKLAADIANSFVEELNKFNTETAMTVGKKYRIFIEQRLKDNQKVLEIAEDSLKNYQEKHHTIALDVEIQSAIGTIAELKSQIILLEVKKGALASSAQFNNPYLYDINKELRELKKQLAKIQFGDKQKNGKEFGAGFSVPLLKLPEVSLEYVRLLRDVKVQEAVYELLTQQYEHAKIMELKDTPTVQVLDRASPPEKKTSPKRSRIVIMAAIFSLILGVVSSFCLEAFENLKKHPDEFKKWQDIHGKLKRDFNSVKFWVLKFLKIRKEK